MKDLFIIYLLVFAIVGITMIYAIPRWADSLPPSPQEQILSEVSR